MAKAFSALRRTFEKVEVDDDDQDISIKTAGVDSPIPSDSDELDDNEESQRNPDGNADDMVTTAIKPIYKKASDGSYTLASEEYIEDMLALQENVTDNLKKIVAKNQAGRIKFQDGKSMKVDLVSASTIMSVHGALNKNNQAKMAAMLAKDAAGFMKMAKFALQQHSFKISGGLQGPAAGPMGSK